MRIKRKLAILLPLAMLLVMLCPVIAMAAEEEVAAQPALYATFWSLIPAIVAIVLALITKEVYSSLLIGVIVGALFASKTVSEAGVVTGFNFIGTVQGVMQGGIISVVSDSYNVGILVFLVILGTMVALMNKAGGSAAFGEWAGTHIKSRVGAQLMTLYLAASSLSMITSTALQLVVLCARFPTSIRSHVRNLLTSSMRPQHLSASLPRSHPGLLPLPVS